MRYLPIGDSGKSALVDDGKYDELMEYRWHLCGGYARTWHVIPGLYSGDPFEIRLVIPMSNIVLGYKPGYIIDHKNRKPLDNRKSNLRYATYGQNACNSARRANRSGYRGVIKRSSALNSWSAQICYEGKQVHLGMYETPQAAAIAYDKAARELHGEFAFCNFGEEVSNG